MKLSAPLALDLTGLKGFSATEPHQAPTPAPDLNPVPVPPLTTTPADLALHLAHTEPMDDPAAQALQLALITSTVAHLVGQVADLQARIEALEDGRWPKPSQ